MGAYLLGKDKAPKDRRINGPRGQAGDTEVLFRCLLVSSQKSPKRPT